MFEYRQRNLSYLVEGKIPVILYLGDHDPSGLNMPVSLQKKFRIMGCTVDFGRIGITLEQIKETGAPPQPAKKKDTRYTAYEKLYGKFSWELDALPPTYIVKLIQDNLRLVMNIKKFNAQKAKMEHERQELNRFAEQYDEIREYLN